MLDAPYALSPRAALRPEPFGALAYHYDNRRLVFLRHRDLATVVAALADHPDLRSCLEAHGIDRERWQSFAQAIEALVAAEIVRPAA